MKIWISAILHNITQYLDENQEVFENSIKSQNHYKRLIELLIYQARSDK